jgi:hypothetical protein
MSRYLEPTAPDERCDLVDMTRAYSDAIQNGRALDDIMNSAQAEMKELSEELYKVRTNSPAGDDGVVGESIDVILCMLDLIFKAKPSITAIEIEAIARRKNEKWKLHYSSSIHRQR